MTASPTMRPLRDTIALADARARIDAVLRPIARHEQVPLLQATGRVLATPVVADNDVPPFARAGMDGYAVRAEDTFGATRPDGKTLRIVDRIFTGETSTRHVGEKDAAEIATGAPLPPGADAVVMVEETAPHDDGSVRVFTPVYPGQHVGRQGADIARGQTALAAGVLLNPSRIGAAAALGLTHLDVYVQPTVAILSTGNEVVAPGSTLRPGHIYDINRYTLATIVEQHGGRAVTYDAIADSLEDLDRAIDAALGADLLVFSGGSSVGTRDLMLDAIKQRGEIIFHGIAVKPGKPTAFGVVQDTPIFGMPGYPTSCLSNAYLLLVPALRRVARLAPFLPHTRRLPLAQRIVSTTGRQQFYTVRIAEGMAHPAFKASGDITSMSHADGYLDIPAQTDIVEAGELVDVLLF